MNKLYYLILSLAFLLNAPSVDAAKKGNVTQEQIKIATNKAKSILNERGNISDIDFKKMCAKGTFRKKTWRSNRGKDCLKTEIAALAIVHCQKSSGFKKSYCWNNAVNLLSKSEKGKELEMRLKEYFTPPPTDLPPALPKKQKTHKGKSKNNDLLNAIRDGKKLNKTSKQKKKKKLSKIEKAMKKRRKGISGDDE